MSEEFKVNLKDFSESELKAAIKAKREIDRFQKKPIWEQLKIILKQNGISLTAIAALLTGGIWQKDNIIRVINPPADVINEQILAHNLPEAVELHTRKIDALSKALNELDVRLNDLGYYVKKKSYSPDQD